MGRLTVAAFYLFPSLRNPHSIPIHPLPPAPPPPLSLQSEIVSLMALCGKTQRQIEVWFRLRRNQDRPCRTKKFAEAT